MASFVELPLSKGRGTVKVDVEDLPVVGHIKWTRRVKKSGVAYAHNTRLKCDMHTLLMGEKGVDHINGDGLDNRRCNLRLASVKQNSYNVGPRTGTASRFKGVVWHKRGQKWQAQIKLDGKMKYLGLFPSEEEAAAAYDAVAREAHGEFARLNLQEAS